MFKKLVNVGLFFLLAYALLQIGMKQLQYRQAEETYEVIKEVARVQSSIGEIISHDRVREVNDDYKCWIQVENTEIDYPIVQGNDNDFYLHYDVNKEASINGSLFIDYRNTWPTDQNIIIYGHNMRNGTMFQELEKYKNLDFFQNKNQIIINDESGSYQYEVFSVYVTDDGSEILMTQFSSDDDYNAYLEYITGKSLYSSDLNVNTKDDIITLFTCSYEFKEARTVVHAKLIK